MPTPGIGDPYWFEWYVGLKHVIEMLNPDNGIESVIFQHPEYDTIDDVVVEYKDDKKQICYQIKHEISTSIMHQKTKVILGLLNGEFPELDMVKMYANHVKKFWLGRTNGFQSGIGKKQ